MIFIDLISKIYIAVSTPNIFDLLGFVNIFLVKNYGISFGMFNSMQYSLTQQVILSVIAVGVIFYILKNCPYTFGISMIVGGAIGNLLNRIYSGYVIDFIDVFYKNFHWPSFNIADSFICIGVFIFALEEHLSKKKKKQ